MNERSRRLAGADISPFTVYAGGSMKRIACVSVIALLITVGVAMAGGNHDPHAVPMLKNQGNTTVSVDGNTVTLTFGPIDLPVGHAGELAASMPIHYFSLPRDMYLTRFSSAVVTTDGRPLPNNYLHHILLINTSRDSVSCPGEPLFFAGAGLEQVDSQFPPGYGVKLAKDDKLMAVVAFYHKVPPTKDVIATFTMDMAPAGASIKEMDVYQVGVNIVCYSKFDLRGPNQTDEGIEINPGVTVMSAPLKFRMDGCVKFAYPHGHDELLLITLDNKSKGQTLLRTVPDVDRDGTLIAFQPHQIYKDPRGFSISSQDEYEITMVYHHPLHDRQVKHGMGNYLLYMTPGACSHDVVMTTSE